MWTHLAGKAARVAKVVGSLGLGEPILKVKRIKTRRRNKKGYLALELV